jgi:hypothetical protein
VTLADELAAAAAAAGAHAAAGEEVAAVMAAEPGAGARVYVVALAAGDELSYLALDAALAPVRDERLLRDAVALAAMAERAEEASGAVAADDIAAAADRASAELTAAGEEAAAAAADEVGGAARQLAAAAAGPRVATPAYLDRMAAAAAASEAPVREFRAHAEALTARLSGLPGEPGEAPARAAWSLLAAAGALAGAGFGAAMSATTGAAEALAADVVRRSRVPLDGA